MAGDRLAQGGRVGKVMRVKAHLGGRGDVGGAVVDEEQIIGRQAGALQNDLVDAAMRLDHAFVARHHSITEMTEVCGGLSLDDRPLALGHVRQRELRRLARGQRFDDGDRLGNRPGKHLVKALIPGADLRRVLRKTGDQRRGVVGERHAAIMLDMPVQGADMRKEPVEIGRFLEDLRIQCAGVPAHDDIADIPENGSGTRARHQPCLALKRGSVLLMM